MSLKSAKKVAIVNFFLYKKKFNLCFKIKRNSQILTLMWSSALNEILMAMQVQSAHCRTIIVSHTVVDY